MDIPNQITGLFPSENPVKTVENPVKTVSFTIVNILSDTTGNGFL
jgi:hypothetical protein